MLADVFYSLRETLREFRLLLVAMFTIGGYFVIVAAVPVLVAFLIKVIVS